MKVVILAGGFGTRLSEETSMIPKPMLEIGGMPVIWHIMKMYSHHGFNDFVILLGYKGYVIKEYFCNYFLHQSDVTVDLKTNEMQVHNNGSEPWKVTLLDTGLHTMTGGRLRRAAAHISDAPFLLTYGDGVADVDISALVEFHRVHKKQVTVTAVQPSGRFGALGFGKNNLVENFMEKPKSEAAWVSGGFFVCEPEILTLIDSDTTVFEQGPLSGLAQDNQLVARKHNGFWECMDTLRDKNHLNELWENDKAPWRIW
jgi:glucose-1-phosphate cytidylyltransferase